MTTPHFDERQLALRHRIATSTLLLLGALVVANAVVNDSLGHWGTGMQQALALLTLAATHFAIRAIWGHAYENPSAPRRSLWLLWSAVTLVMSGMLVADAVVGRYEFWAHGRAGISFELTAMLAYFVIVAAVALARRHADQRTYTSPQ